MTTVADDFRAGIGPGWQQHLTGRGCAITGTDGLRLTNRGATGHEYTNAQIDDYQHLRRRDFSWRPPVRLIVRARFSHPSIDATGDPTAALNGTAGFGFWNDPFAMSGGGLPALPQAVWFFYAAPPSDIKLDRETPGWGWKAATIDARRWQFAALAPTMPVAIPLMNLRPFYRFLWPIGQRAIGVSERVLPVSMAAWHIYSLDWTANSVRFGVDGQTVLESNRAPKGPLGLVVWLDNQFMQVTPWGQLAWGTVAKAESQWLDVDWVVIERLAVR